MKKLIVANWKMNPGTAAEAVRLAKATEGAARKYAPVGVVVAPPFVYLGQAAMALKRAKLGSEDAFWAESGPYTGEVSPTQLKGLGVTHVILGHSERRRHLGETDAMVNAKLKAVLNTGLTAILCVGEPKEVRRRGFSAAKRFVESQLKKDLAGVRAKRLIVAYEPVWAIGTGVPDKPEESEAMGVFIKSFVKRKLRFAPAVLYGGSVNAKNAHSFLSKKHIDGALVGGASLKPKEFAAIIAAAR